MPLNLPVAHRLARLNYLPRALAFGYTFVALGALVAERGDSNWVLFFGALQFLVYPHIAYLHARIAADSKRAELRNLMFDALMLGAWAAQMRFALWPTCGLLAAISLNNAANGGYRKLLRGVALFLLGGVLWGAATGYRFDPNTGPLVSMLSGVGLVFYTSFIGEMLFEQNTRLLRTRDALRKSEEQFRFIAEHAGDLVAVLDAGGLFRYASASHARHLDAQAYAPGRDWLELVHPDDRPDAIQYLGRITAAPTDAREGVNLRMRTRNGAWRAMECRGNTVWDERGYLQMLVLILRDIEARVRSDVEQQLASEAQTSSGGPPRSGDRTGSVQPG
jgi:PAS domain S-box-containing protein